MSAETIWRFTHPLAAATCILGAAAFTAWLIRRARA